MNNNLPIIHIHDATVAYNKRAVIWDADLELEAGKLTAIVGPNGAGKSTLIKAILNIVKPLHGYIEVEGKPVESRLKDIAYVPQRESVDWNFPISVFEVVLMGRYVHLGWLKQPKAIDKEKAINALDKLGILHLKDRQIGELSGGQQQRVFLARAIAQEAKIYLLDEPFAGVDIATEETIFKLLKSLRDSGATIIVVHHDIQTVKQYFDNVVLLNLRVIASGAVSEVFTDENLQKTYGGRLTILDKTIESVREA